MREGILLALVNGPWQACSLLAALAHRASDERVEVVLVDMFDGSPMHRAATRILLAHGVEKLHTIDKQVSLHALPAVLRGLGLARVHTVATYGAHRPIARYLVNSLPHAQLLIYEEGLRTYVPQSSSLRDRLRSRLAQSWGRIDRSFGKGWTPPALTHASYCLLLADCLPVPTQIVTAARVPAAALRAVLDALPAPVVKDLPAQHYVVIVGQYYAQLGQLSARAELEAYVAAAEAIVARGQTPIWRGHIRERDEVLAALQARCPQVRRFADFVEDASLPLELYRDMFGERCAGVVSFSSSALFYLRLLYGTEASTLLTAPMLKRMRYPHRAACELALAHVPAFRSSPALGRPPSERAESARA